MSQKRITSFFSAPKNGKNPQNAAEKLPKSPVKVKAVKEDVVSHDSPVKRSTRRSIRPIIDSDDEEEVENVEKAEDKSDVDEKQSEEDEVKSEKDESEDEIIVKKKKTTTKKKKIESEDEKDEEEVEIKSENEEEIIEKPKKTSTKKGKTPVTKKTKPATKGKKRKSNEKKDSPKETKKAKISQTPKKEDEKNDPQNGDDTETVEIILPSNYNPGRNNYKPTEHACWKKGEKVPYAALSKTLEIIEDTSARLKMIEILSNFLRSVIILTPEDLIHCIYLCLNRLAPAYEGLELGVGDTIVIKAIAQTTGRTVEKLKAEINVKGDLGLVAESSRSNQKTMFQPAPLTVAGVFKKLKEIAQMIGNTSMTKKMEKIQSMLVACRFSEARFLVRSLGSKLRIGLAEQSLLVALAHAVALTPPDGSELKSMSKDNLKKKLDESALIIKTTYCECPNYDKIIEILLKHGIEKLPEFCQITPGIPLKPMLAQPTKGVQDVFHRFEKSKFSCEFKYDGERAQIHLLQNGDVHVYSRNQENNTSKYPDIVKRIPQICKENVENCIIDTEAVAWDSEKKQILPFQVLSTRKRKDANEMEIKVKVCVFAFDLLFLNGKSLVKETFSERRRLLKENFKEEDGEFMFVEAVDSDDVDEIAEFLDTAIKGNCEGLMVKTLEVDATYEISKRSRNWLKLKKDYLDGVGDSLDLVVIGGYYGKGKRTGNYGGFLLACYDDENEEYQTICKIGTGFSDEVLESRSKFFKEHVIQNPKSYYAYDQSHSPDVWFDAVQVWEVKCADISISPVHKAALGIVDETKGLSLRFPRFIRIREDKDPENATSASQVSDLYRNQEQIKNQNEKTSSKVQDDEDY